MHILLTLLIALVTAIPGPSDVTAQEGGLAGPSDTFRREALETIAQDDRRNFHFIAAKLRTGIRTDLAWRQLDTLLAEPSQDMFWTYPATAFYFYCRDLLNESYRRRFREVWKTWSPYRGDTENHFLMYYETLYLMSQEWPDLPGSEWFNGKSSKENFREAEEYLNHWIDETVDEGQTEWDSPRYFYFYILPLLTLRDHATDRVLAKRAEMMLEYLLADYAIDYLNRSYCGAHSRDGDGSVIDPRRAEATSYSDFFWEDSLTSILPDLAFAAMSSFRSPSIIREIAHDRTTPYLSFEWKRSRAKMRFSPERYTRVRKQIYMTGDYALGSIQGGLQQPIQQHTWDITFAGPEPNNTLYGLHPYASGYELGMFFPEEPELMEESILSSKASYGKESKWIGGSPYEEIRQWGQTLFATYHIPPGTRYQHVDFYFSGHLKMLIRDMGGWVVANASNTGVGIRIDRGDSTAWFDEDGYRRLRIYGNEIAYTVTTIPANLLFSNGGVRLADQASSDSLQLKNLPNDSTMLFSSPYLQSERGTGILRMIHNGRERILDFRKNSIVERKVE